MTQEQELLVAFRDANERLNKIKAEKDEAQKEFDKAEAELVMYLQDKGATSTARYEGIGFATLPKPRLYASYIKEDEEKVFEFLRGADEGEIIKESIAPSALSSAIGRMIERGEMIPMIVKYGQDVPIVNHYFKQKATFYARA